MNSLSKPMEGIKGLCLLCTKKTRVIIPQQSKHITCKLFELLENHIDVHKFKASFCEIKVCLSCLYEIVTMAKLKENITDVWENNNNSCSLCTTKDNLVSTNSLDNDFPRLVKNVLRKEMSQTKCAVCLHCVMYLKWLERIKYNFFQKYPFLKLSHKSQQTFDGQLKHLKPLKNLDFNVSANKEDVKLWAKVPYVKLSVFKQKKSSIKKSKKPMPNKKHKIIKVKLWQNFKQGKSKSTKKELVVNITKSELNEPTTVIENVESEQIAKSNSPQPIVVDSDEDWDSVGLASYVEHIQKNNDDIFNQLIIDDKQKRCVDNDGELEAADSQIPVQENSTDELNGVAEILPVQPEINGTSCEEAKENTITNQQIDEQNDTPTLPENLICSNQKSEQFFTL